MACRPASGPACVGGRPPALIPVLGEVTGHPADTARLVMALIDPAFRSLASLPSLETCTQDVYPADARFTPATALAIARASPPPLRICISGHRA